MHRVAAILYPHALATSITLPAEILRAASQLATTRTRQKQELCFSMAANELAPIALFGGLHFEASTTISDLGDLDVLILPAIWRSPRGTISGARPWLPKLRALAAAGTRICSVGTASCMLAEAGILKGRPATTHWNYFQRFAAPP